MVIGGIRTRDVVFVRRETDLVQVAEVMREQHVGSLGVVEDRANGPVPVGIVTDRDIVVSVVAAQVDPLKLNAGEVMRGDVLVAHEQDDIAVVAQRMQQKGVRRIPVVSAGGALVGIAALDDLFAELGDEMQTLVSLFRSERAREKRVRRIGRA